MLRRHGRGSPRPRGRGQPPFIGTDGTGHVFPGATRPFGMVAPSPDNASGGWDCTSGDQYRAPRILGFSNTHISGAGIPDLGDVLLQPRQVSAGRRWTLASRDFSSRCDKRSEAASPGHCAVTLLVPERVAGMVGTLLLHLQADGFAAQRPWAASATLNGQLLDARAVPHAALAGGGELRFTMRPLP